LCQNDADYREKAQTYNRERARTNVEFKAKYDELLEKMNLKLAEK